MSPSAQSTPGEGVLPEATWSHRNPPQTWGRRGLGAVASCVLLIVITGALGPSGASPGLGPSTALPAWSFDLHPSSGLVSVLLAVALVVGTLGLLATVRAVGGGWTPSVRRLLAGTFVAVGLLVLVPPMGSADHLSYAAYGRIALQGGDPYGVAPDVWRSDTDPVVSAVLPPWRHATSVYGPVATVAQETAARLGGASVRRVVLVLSLEAGAAFLATALLLVLAAPGDPRAVLLWGLNPLLLWSLVAGAHVDAIAVLPAVASVLVVVRTRRQPLAVAALAGTLGALALSVKLPYALGLVALAWLLRRSPARLVTMLASAGVVTAVSYAAVARHAFDGTVAASRMVSSASMWGPVAHGLDHLVGSASSRHVVAVASVAVALALAVVVGRTTSDVPGRQPQHEAARVWMLGGLAYVVCAGYVLPWYDAIAWAPMVLFLPSCAAASRHAQRLVDLLAVHGCVLALAYVPGRVTMLSHPVKVVTLTLRSGVAPVLAWLIVVAVLRWAPTRERLAPARQ